MRTEQHQFILINFHTLDHHSIVVHTPALGARVSLALILPVTSVQVTNRFSPVRFVNPAPHLTRRFRSRITRDAVTITSGGITYILTALSRIVNWITLQGRDKQNNFTFSLLYNFVRNKAVSTSINRPLPSHTQIYPPPPSPFPREGLTT